MKVTEISVEAGEVRNHPFEYGNRRSTIRLTATLEEGEDATKAIEALRSDAESHVLEELDTWEQNLIEEQRIWDAVTELKTSLQFLSHQLSEEGVERYREEAKEHIAKLPEAQQEKWTEKLEEVYQESIQQIEQERKERELEEAQYTPDADEEESIDW